MESSGELSEASWQGIVTNGNPVTDIIGTGNPIQVIDTHGALHPRRFYRIAVEP